MKTIFMLLAEYERPIVELDEICEKYFNISKNTAKARAKSGTLPLPAFRLGGKQKNPWFIHIGDLAKLIDQKMLEANEQHIG